jgi:NADPH:quinone reductase-like Zn-dependent oxidoreductase
MPQNKAWIVASHPTGWVREDNFTLTESPTPQPKDGEVLVKNLWLSLDPYMRLRLSHQKSYIKGVGVGEVMTGETAGEVIESRHPKFRAGDTVTAYSGWSSMAVMQASYTKVDASKHRVLFSPASACRAAPPIWPGGHQPTKPSETVVVPQRRARWAASWASSPRTGAAVSSALPAVKRNALTS